MPRNVKPPPAARACRVVAVWVPVLSMVGLVFLLPNARNFDVGFMLFVSVTLSSFITFAFFGAMASVVTSLAEISDSTDRLARKAEEEG